MWNRRCKTNFESLRIHHARTYRTERTPRRRTSGFRRTPSLTVPRLVSECEYDDKFDRHRATDPRTKDNRRRTNGPRGPPLSSRWPRPVSDLHYYCYCNVFVFEKKKKTILYLRWLSSDAAVRRHRSGRSGAASNVVYPARTIYLPGCSVPCARLI